MIIPDDVAKRAATNCHVEGECLVSDYSTGSHGYAQIGWSVGKERFGTTAHRAAYVFWTGEQPGELTVDHTCRNRRCVRRIHLRLMSNHDNSRMNIPANGHYSTEWSCPKNHPASSRMVLPSGKPVCADCRRESQERYKEQKREQYLDSQRRYNAKRSTLNPPGRRTV